VDASTEEALVTALDVIRESGQPYTLIGGGTNLIAADGGFAGFVLRFTGSRMAFEGTEVTVEAGARLQDLMDASIERGLRGLETMTGIPGWVGGAIYGNAGAYGRSIHELVGSVRYFDGAGLRELRNAECEFAYRESVFKRRKGWVVLSARLRLQAAEAVELKAVADRILLIRNEKYPPSMRCAGSIFKNLLLAELPEAVRRAVPQPVVREGKVPAGYFLEAVGAKGLKEGDIQVADYHANLIYNSGNGSEAQLRELIRILKARVWDRFGLELEEEIQYI